MSKETNLSIKTGAIIAASAIALMGILWVVYTGSDQTSSSALDVREIVQDKPGKEGKHRTLVNLDDAYDVEKRLANASVYTNDKAMKDEITYLTEDLKEEVNSMNIQSELFEKEINFQELMAESDQLIDEIAKDTGTTKQKLMQDAENDILAQVSLPETIELEQEIAVTEQRKDELVNRFEALSSKTE